MTIVVPLRELGLLRMFPGRTETDLYLWISEHRAVLEKQLGWSVRNEGVMIDLAVHENPKVESDLSETGQWRRNKIVDRYNNRLFRDILVPLSGEEEGWQALEQALVVARYESADVHGIHVITPKSREDPVQGVAIRDRFRQRCAETGLGASLVVVKGDVPDLVCHRALLADLLVLNTAHPPAPGLSSLGSGLRSIIRRSARPILTVSGQVSPLDRALVAFDGSTKAQEAVFVAAYLAEIWMTNLTVLTLSDTENRNIQDYAKNYFDLHQIKADYIVAKGPQETILNIMADRDVNLVLMGGYSGSPWQEIIIGSLVNFLLRKSECPLLICR